MTRGDPQPRFLGIDEGPFSFSDATVPICGVMTRGAVRVEAVVVEAVTVDGWDATERVSGLLARLRGAGPDAVLIDGITLGGMNLVDLTRIAAETGRPVLGITREAPERSAMERALRRAPDPERRLPLLPIDPPLPIDLGAHTLHVQVGAPPERPLAETEVRRLLRASIVEGALPECLRLAHHVATALVRGVSGTKA